MTLSLADLEALGASKKQIADVRRQLLQSGATGAPPAQVMATADKPAPKPERKKGKRRGPAKRKEPNRNEIRFAKNVLDDWRRDGSILEYDFERITFNLADGEKYTPDYPAWDQGGALEIWEVKGEKAWEDSRIKFKHATDRFPCITFYWAAWNKSERIYDVEIWRAGRYLRSFECGPSIGPIPRELATVKV